MRSPTRAISPRAVAGRFRVTPNRQGQRQRAPCVERRQVIHPQQTTAGIRRLLKGRHRGRWSAAHQSNLSSPMARSLAAYPSAPKSGTRTSLAAVNAASAPTRSLSRRRASASQISAPAAARGLAASVPRQIAMALFRSTTALMVALAQPGCSRDEAVPQLRSGCRPRHWRSPAIPHASAR